MWGGVLSPHQSSRCEEEFCPTSVQVWICLPVSNYVLCFVHRECDAGQHWSDAIGDEVMLVSVEAIAFSSQLSAIRRSLFACYHFPALYARNAPSQISCWAFFKKSPSAMLVSLITALWLLWCKNGLYHPESVIVWSPACHCVKRMPSATFIFLSQHSG